MTPEFAPLGDSAVRAAFGDEISPQINRRVLRLGAALEAAPVPGVIEWVPGYATVTVYYQPWRIGYEELCAELERRWRQGAKPSAERGRLVTVPVCYGGEWGPDLAGIAALHELTPAEVIRRHAGGRYRVYFLGFLPGFAYLGGLPPSLATPRRQTPRLHVPAGAVGIAGGQTGVYPCETPGGWQIIGRTPLRLYDPDRLPPALLAAGDTVRFIPIAARQFEEAV